MDKKFLQEKGILEEAKRFQYIMEYVTGAGSNLEELDGNGDGLDDATGMAAGGAMPGADPMAGGAAGAQDPAMAGGMPGADPMAGGAAGVQDPAMAGGAAGADPNAAQGVPGFDPQPVQDTDPAATADQSFDEAEPDAAGGDEEVIDVDELVDGQKRNEEAIGKLTDKFEQFLEKFSEFQGELKSNAEFMANLQGEFEKRNPTSVEKMTMRSLQSKPFQETPEEYMKYDAPENYSPEDDNNGVGEPRYTITRDDVRNATDYSSIAKTLRDNENSTLKNLLGLNESLQREPNFQVTVASNCEGVSVNGVPVQKGAKIYLGSLQDINWGNNLMAAMKLFCFANKRVYTLCNPNNMNGARSAINKRSIAELQQILM